MQDLMGHVRAAVEKYNLIDEGDRIAVGVSGGKDSMYLLYALAMMRRYYPKKYEVVALTADPCFNGTKTDYSEIEANRFNLSIPLYVRKKGIEPVSLNLQECLDSWQENAAAMHGALERVLAMLNGEEVQENE